MNSLELLKRLTAIPAPPGQEGALAAEIIGLVGAAGYHAKVDAKGNVIAGSAGKPARIVVTAHMDEIAMLVRRVLSEGTLEITSMGGLYPWKLGEGPVDILASTGSIPGVLGFGSIHTDAPASRAQRAREAPLGWSSASVFTGLEASDLAERGVRPGTRVVVSKARRSIVELGDHLAGYFLDDRADLVSWLLALGEVGTPDGVVFAATAAEEVGGEGAQYLFHKLHPEVCIALELGPYVPDAPSELSASPSVWSNDGYSAAAAADLDLVASVADEIGIAVQFQAFSRGGSDASCSASRGLCARPFTLGLPMENSHGFEIMHRDAMDRLAELTIALIRRLMGE